MKRFFDLLIAIPSFFLFLPFMLVIAVLVRIKLGSPVLFRQQRPGRNGTPFVMVKFRTMRDAVGRDGTPLPDCDRLTPFGKFLRATSLDELPELINVIQGSMSIVGPRPLLMEYLPRYSREQARRHEVRPGITGWAQINGRNAISWREKFELDIWYVDNHTLLLDLKILLLTVLQVFRRKDVCQPGHATMEVFTGNDDHPIDQGE